MVASLVVFRTGALLVALLACFTLQAGFSAGSEAELRLHGHGFGPLQHLKLQRPFSFTDFGIDLDSVAPWRLRPANSQPRRRKGSPRALNPAPVIT